jgi:hypothetical protein
MPGAAIFFYKGYRRVAYKVEVCPMTPRDVEEYSALRATIRERGAVRIWVVVATLAAWAAATVATAALAALPVATFVPLLLLATGFEAVFQLHTGVERIGRYLQVFHEGSGEPRSGTEWESTAMAYGRMFPGGSDPLFTSYFFFATVLNFVPVILAEPARIEVTVVGAVHAFFVGRLFIARHRAGRQRAIDLDRFQKIKGAG